MAHPAGGSADSTDVAGNHDNDEIDDDQNAVSDDVDDEDSEVPDETAEAVAYRLRKEANLDPELLAEMIDKSLRSVYRYLLQDGLPRRPGIARIRTRRQAGPARQPGRGT